MGIISNFVNAIKPRLVAIFGGFGMSFSPWARDAYEQETVRAIIDCIATHASKAEALHVVLDDQGRIKETKRNSEYARLFNLEPNPLMTGFDFKYKLVAQLQDKTTALAYIKWTDGKPEMIMPIQYTDFQFREIVGGGYAVEFVDAYDGKSYVLSIDDVVVLRKFYNRSAVAGDGNGPIRNTLTMIKASDEGLTEALAVSNKIRGILKQKKSMLSPEDVSKGTDDFAERFSRAAKEGGIIGVDSMEDFTPISTTAWSANASQIKAIRQNLFYFWRLNEAILTSDYTEAQWQAFYEGVIEPILTMMSEAFTRAIFTQEQIEEGNRIIFSSSAMLNASMQTKVNLITNTKEIGVLTLNEQRQLLGLPPIEGGDTRYFSLNYINEKDASKHQTGSDPKKDEGE